MEDPIFIAVLIATFLLRGAVKGVVWLCLPRVALGLMTVASDLTTAMALLLVPSFATNAYQGTVGGKLVPLLRRLWPFLLAAMLLVTLGAEALTRVSLPWASALLGVLKMAYALSGLRGLRISSAPSREWWAGPVFGMVNGIFTGITGSFVVPGVMYLQALGLSRDALVQSMGILFTLSTVALAVSLGQHGLLSAELGLMSLAGLVPAFLGMYAGQTIRGRLSEARFRSVFLWGVLLLGVYILVNAILGISTPAGQPV